MENIYNIVPAGKKNAIHQCELAARLGVAPITAKTIIREHRKNGVPILSDICGYWIAENDDEIQRFVSTMRRQAYSRLACANALLNTTKGVSAGVCIDQKEWERCAGCNS